MTVVSAIDGQLPLTRRPGWEERPTGACIGRGDVFGRYLVWERLGSGGMGVVYSAIDPELERKVALKLFHLDDRQVASSSASQTHQDSLSSGQQADVGAQILLLNEAKSAAKVDNPYVVSIFDAGIHQGRVYVAMEFVAGETIRSLLRAGQPSRATALSWLRQTLLGLAAVHHVNLVHADFKPENTMVGSDGRVRLLDFGLARAARHEIEPATVLKDNQENDATQFGLRLIGTLPYLAPELLQSSHVSVKSDLFAWGVFAYEVLCGFRPFGAADLAELKEAHFAAKWQQVREFRRLPRWLQRVIQHALAPDLSQRPTSANELLQALDQGLASRSFALYFASFSLVGLMVAGVATVWLSASRDGGCEIPERQLESVWNPERVATLTTAFFATKSPLAKDAAQRFDEVMRTWSSSWRESYLDSCLAHQRGGHFTATTFDDQLGCLQHELKQAGHFVRSFEHADLRAVEQSVDALEQLDDPARCLKSTRQSEQLLPASATQRQHVEHLYNELAQVYAFALAGRDKAALETAMGLASAIRSSGWTPLQADYFALLGKLQYINWNYRGSYLHSVRSYLAQRAWGEDTKMFSGLTGQIAAASFIFSFTEESREMGRLIEAVAQRSQSDITDFVANMLQYGAALINSQRHREAERVLLTTLDKSSKAGYAEFRALSILWANLAAAKIVLNRPEDGEQDSRIAVRYVEMTHGRNHPAVTRVLFNLAYALNMQGRFTEALEVSMRGRAILENLTGKWTAQAVPFYHYSLDSQVGLGRFGEALAEYPQVVPLYERTFGAAHVRTLMMTADWIETLIDGQRLDEAEVQLERVRHMTEPTWFEHNRIEFRTRAAEVWVALYRGDLVRADNVLTPTFVAELQATAPEPDLFLDYAHALHLAIALAKDDRTAIAQALEALSEAPLAFRRMSIARGYGLRVRGYVRLGQLQQAQRALQQTREFIERARDPQDARLGELDALSALVRASSGDIARARQLYESAKLEDSPINPITLAELRAKVAMP